MTNNVDNFAAVINQFSRYQAGFTLNSLYPKIDGKCACGCGEELSKSRKKWHSDECRNSSYIKFAIIKGDTSVIREQLYLRDMGACHCCGEITDNWQADHIKPVYMGGGASDIDNFQTLCVDCHKITTYNLSHHRAISSHAASIFFIRSLYAVGQLTNRLLNMSNDMQSLGLATSPFFKTNVSA